MSDPRLPRISIVTPSFNQAAFLTEAIDSVLGQRYPELEYIVLDGGSTDGSVEIIESRAGRISHWRSSRDEGQSAALREGFALSTGEVLGWLNSDDVLESGALLAVGDVFARNPDVDIIYGNMLFVDTEGRRLFTAYPVLSMGILLYENRFVPQQAMFWRRSLYERVGGIDPSLRFAMDFDLLLKFLAAGARVVKIQRVLGRFRVHPDAKSSTIRDVMREEGDAILSRYLPAGESKFACFFKRWGFRGRRFLREPRSLVSAIRSRAVLP